jgi:hypothetical protein
MKAYMQRYHLAVVSAFLLLLILAKGCEKDELLTNSTAKLSFSQDTVMFDTVFTGIGSATKRFKVYNNHDAALKISSIRMAKGSSSNFHMNVDGVPGQWGAYTILSNGATYVFGGLHFMPGSFENVINYAEIKNANKGIQLDSAIGNQPALRISNTKISNMNTAGIYAQTSTINGNNLVINNCGSHAIALTLGGSYRFNHVTIANYTPYNSRNSASVAINNYYLSGGGGICLRIGRSYLYKLNYLW